LDWVFSLFPILAERRVQRAGSLSGGQQQMLALGRALMARPRYLLMDEPSLGLAPIVVDQLFDLIDTIHQAGLGILIVEQNVERTLDLCQRGYVLEEGKVIMEGSRAELLASARVRQAYLAL
jgi:branched-chain amino acid transport system ATP-binding protein